MQLREAAFGFIQENTEAVVTSEVLKDFSNNLLRNNSAKFLRDFTLYSVQKASKQIQDLMMKANQVEISQEREEHHKEIRKGNGKKRMEPVQDGADEENPTLKKN